MSLKMNQLVPFALLLLIATACTSSTTAEEQVKIETMDSTSRVLKKNKEDLQKQTEKVEASLEKLDAEFTTTEN